jgi:tetratricopeptide (TPR) repeat protein
MFFDMELESPVQVPGTEDVFELEPSMSHSAMPPRQQEKQKSHPEWEDSSMLKISEEAYAATDNLELGMEEEPLSLGDDDLFEIEPSIARESVSHQEYEDSKVDLNVDKLMKPPEIKTRKGKAPEEEELAFEVEMDEPPDHDTSDIQLMDIDKDMLIQSPSASADSKEKSSDGYSSSAIDEIDLDSIMMDEEPGLDQESPFKETAGPDQDMAFDSDEDLLKDEGIFIEEAYLEVEKNIEDELEAIMHWMKELEKQRTSTIEKNMMEIFEEFKKGVDEKIGQEDYDTRYNLGIAYKEMGLLEEAIHEFLISSKHPLKYFDSAGLLGMCFREKGMFSEAINWFDKALESPDRRREEYLAVKYEMVITLKLKEDYKAARGILEEIIRVSPDYRNVVHLYQEIKGLMAQQRY